MGKQQFFFDAKGHLIHSDKAAVLKWVFFLKKRNESSEKY
jgi:hypothetical protein